MKRLLSFPPISFTLEAFSTYGRCGVAQAAAALSYFLILTLFPLLMCVNYFIGLFHLSLEQLLSGLDQVLPDQALAVMQDYLAYASLNQSPAIVAAALVAIALSASAGLRALLLAMDKLYGLEHPGGLRRIALSVILSLLFLLTIYLSVVVIFTGDWFFHLLETHLPHPLLRLIPLSRPVQSLALDPLSAAVLLRPAAGAGHLSAWALPGASAAAGSCCSVPSSPPSHWWQALFCSLGSSACPPATPCCTALWPPSSSFWCGSTSAATCSCWAPCSAGCWKYAGHGITAPAHRSDQSIL